MRLLSVILLSSLAFPASSPVQAQSESFRAAARGARELESLTPLNDSLFGECRGPCRRARRQVRRATHLVSLPAVGRVELGPYERVRGGFRVRVAPLRESLAGGVLATPGDDPIAEHFVPVTAEHAARWRSRNALDRLRVRLLFRLGRDLRDGERATIELQPRAVQVYNASTGDVLVDTLREGAHGGEGAPSLEGRVTLWDATTNDEVRYRAPSGVISMLGVQVREAAGGRVVILTRREGVEDHELSRFVAMGPSASLAVLERSPGQLLIVFTAQRPTDERPGSGVVELWSVDGDPPRAQRLARWTGSNEETPPAWVRDPSAPLP